VSRQRAGVTGDLLSRKERAFIFTPMSPRCAWRTSTTRKFLLENPAIVRNFVKSYIEAVHRLKTDRTTGMKIAAKYLRWEDAELLKKTYESSIDENKLPIRVRETVTITHREHGRLRNIFVAC
jgi:hypothetical protein